MVHMVDTFLHCVSECAFVLMAMSAGAPISVDHASTFITEYYILDGYYYHRYHSRQPP